MKPNPLALRDYSQLIIIDMQQRLCDAMATDAIHTVIKNTGILLQSALLLEIPVIYTEQYPQGLGVTVPDLQSWLAADMRIEKTTFSCCEEPRFNRHLTSDRPQIILAGMEAHICILQTALQLQQMGRQVFVAEDAVTSRNVEHKTNALSRLRQSGIIVTNTESILFEWLAVAEGELFKKISTLIR